jgi:hypothetical protein
VEQLQILFKTELNIEFILLQLPDLQPLLFQVLAPDCIQAFLANPQTLLNTLLLPVVEVALVAITLPVAAVALGDTFQLHFLHRHSLTQLW